MIEQKYDNLCVKIFSNRVNMGKQAAVDAAKQIMKCLAEKETINCMFAAAPSQTEFLAALAAHSEIPWERINAFHMDEYVGFEIYDSRSFSGFLNEAIFNKVSFRTVNLINGMNDPETECGHYEKLLEENPVDIVFMGVGENGHIAFNDPSVADFNDKKAVKTVELEESCRIQQVNDGCFETLDQVPQKAVTVTIPGLMKSRFVFCMVPNERKSQAVRQMIYGEISETCPASILRKKPGAKLYLDADSSSEL